MIPLAVFSATAPPSEIATAVPPLPTLIDPETATAVADRVVVVLPGTAPDCALIDRSPAVAVRRDPLIVTALVLSVVSFSTSAPATESDTDTSSETVDTDRYRHRLTGHRHRRGGGDIDLGGCRR